MGAALCDRGMRRVAIHTPAVFPDAPQPGEYVRGADGAARIACIECGVCQRVDDLRLRWCCVNVCCEATAWVELATSALN